MKKPHSKKLHPAHKWRRIDSAFRLLAVVAVTSMFGLLGYTFLHRGSAATYAVSKEAESGTLSGNAILAANSGASSSGAVRFGGTTAAGWSDADFFLDNTSFASKQAATWASSNPAGAARMRKMAEAGKYMEWIGDWIGTKDKVQTFVTSYMSRVGAQGPNTIGLLAMYAIPYRDCGGQSGGGYVDANTYNGYVAAVSAGIGQKRAIVIVEPDALPQLTTCLNAGQQTQRLQMLASAVNTLKTNNKNVKVYLDAGNSNWIDANTMSGRLNSAGVAKADGFATNVSNFKTTANEIAYGNSISGKIGGKHFVIDTSRNGLGPGTDWCNPPGRALGAKPTLNTNSPLVDAFLWIKKAGASDGACNGGPSAGQWWPDYADGLAQRAGY